jgi:hypothetical protein
MADNVKERRIVFTSTIWRDLDLTHDWEPNLPEADHLTVAEALWVIRTQNSIRLALASPYPPSLQQAWQILGFHVDLEHRPAPDPGVVKELLERAWGMLEFILMDSRGFKEFTNWMDADPAVCETTADEALSKLKRILMERLATRSKDVERISLGDAVRILSSPNPRDQLGEFIRARRNAGDKLKQIATALNADGRWGLGWNEDRVSREKARYLKRLTDKRSLPLV